MLQRQCPRSASEPGAGCCGLATFFPDSRSAEQTDGTLSRRAEVKAGPAAWPVQPFHTAPGQGCGPGLLPPGRPPALGAAAPGFLQGTGRVFSLMALGYPRFLEEADQRGDRWSLEL